MSSSTPSGDRVAVARALAEACPPRLGREIALTGSTALGLSDEYSDLELNLWVDEMPSAAAREEWLTRVQASDVWLDNETLPDRSVWTAFSVHGIFVEAGWQTFEALEEWLERVVAAESTDHEILMPADALVHAVPLRTEHRLGVWRSRLADYPEPLRQRLIESALAQWGYPATPAALARRGERLRLTASLIHHAHLVLRILFALNRLWEPDWKWIDHRSQAMEIKPRALAKRLNAMFAEPCALDAVTDLLQLIRDTLELLPRAQFPSTARALEWVERGHAVLGRTAA
jgi:hypothetical protein